MNHRMFYLHFPKTYTQKSLFVVVVWSAGFLGNLINAGLPSLKSKKPVDRRGNKSLARKDNTTPGAIKSTVKRATVNEKKTPPTPTIAGRCQPTPFNSPKSLLLVSTTSFLTTTNSCLFQYVNERI
jgi:hypothetical protein